MSVRTRYRMRSAVYETRALVVARRSRGVPSILLRLQPVDQLLDDLVDARPAGVQPHVSILVGIAPRVVQPFALEPIAYQPAPPIGGHARDPPTERDLE